MNQQFTHISRTRILENVFATREADAGGGKERRPAALSAVEGVSQAPTLPPAKRLLSVRDAGRSAGWWSGAWGRRRSLGSGGKTPRQFSPAGRGAEWGGLRLRAPAPGEEHRAGAEEEHGGGRLGDGVVHECDFIELGKRAGSRRAVEPHVDRGGGGREGE